MKVPSFKKFLEEEDSKAIVQTGLNSKSIDNSVTKEIINSRLANATSNPFLTPYIALGSIARILAYVNIVVPQYTFLDRDEGEVVFDATQVGQIAGVNLDGSPARSEADHFIYFSYSMNDEGYYDCFAALVDSDELEDIMDMGGDDDVDQFDVDQKVNEEKDYFAGVRPSLYVFKHTDEKGTKHFLSFHKNGDITYHNKTSDGKVGNSHPEMKPLYAKSSKDHMQNALYDFARHVAKEKVTGVRHALARSARKVNEENVDEQTQINEISAKTYGNYIRKASRDIEDRAGTVADVKQQKSGFTQGSYYHTHLSNVEKNQQKKVDQRKRGISTATNKLVSKTNEELKGDQHKLDVAEPKGKLTSADFKKLRGEEVDESNTPQQTKKK